MKFILKARKNNHNGQTYFTVPKPLRPLINKDSNYLVEVKDLGPGDISKISIDSQTIPAEAAE